MLRDIKLRLRKIPSGRRKTIDLLLNNQKKSLDSYTPELLESFFGPLSKKTILNIIQEIWIRSKGHELFAEYAVDELTNPQLDSIRLDLQEFIKQSLKENSLGSVIRELVRIHDARMIVSAIEYANKNPVGSPEISPAYLKLLFNRYENIFFSIDGLKRIYRKPFNLEINSDTSIKDIGLVLNGMKVYITPFLKKNEALMVSNNKCLTFKVKNELIPIINNSRPTIQELGMEYQLDVVSPDSSILLVRLNQ